MISARVASDKPVALTEDTPVASVKFTYSVYWVETDKTVQDRLQLETQSRGQFFPKSLEVHWLSVINSTVLVLLLVGFVFIILVTLSYIYSRSVCYFGFENFR